MTASIVIYNHTINDIKKVIKSLIESSCVTKVFIIDNSPNKIDLGLVDTRFEYVFNGKNLGYGAAHNVAIRKAFQLNSEYHLVINPDVYFERLTLEAILTFMENNSDVGYVMPKVLYLDGSVQYLCKLLPTPFDWIGRRFYPIKKHLAKRNYVFELGFTGYDKVMNVPYLSGCFMFLRTSALKEVGLFDENIFMYCEDTDLSRRINSKYKTVFYPEVTIYHEFQKGPHKNLKLLWYNILSSIYYFNKWGWFFDRERRNVNRKVLLELGYKN